MTGILAKNLEFAFKFNEICENLEFCIFRISNESNV